MKKVSAKVFFTVLWRGVCQVLGWFFGLFGYKRDGKFAKCVWGLFATSAAIVMAIIAVVCIYGFGYEACDWYAKRYQQCERMDCDAITHVCRNIYFHDHDDGKGYVFNMSTGEKMVERVAWIMKPTGNDTLVCFSNGEKRGYFSKNTGRVVIEPKYDHAWIFSEGLACVEENGFLKFIDGTGKVVIDSQIAYQPYRDGHAFHNGYCIVETDDEEHYGVMDKTGKFVLPMEYSSIKPTDNYEMWCVQKGEQMAVLDKELKPIMPLMEWELEISDGTINATMPDNTLRKYSLQGELIDDFYIIDFRKLEYEKDEILQRTRTHDDDGDEYDVPIIETFHPKATARLRAYAAGNSYEGLMTADGHRVTMPLYKEIDAIGYDLYLCTTNYFDKVILNGKGEIVR